MVDDPSIPSPHRLLEEGDRLTPSWFQHIRDLPAWVREWGTEQFSTELWSWLIELPDNGDYRVIVNHPYACTVNSITTRSAAGTCTLTGKINTTALGGTANSVSTTETTQTHTSANVLSIGDDFVLTISSNVSCEKVSVTVNVTRTVT